MSISEEEMRRYMIAFYGHNPEWENVPLRDLHFISQKRFQYLQNGSTGEAPANTSPQDLSKPLLASTPALALTPAPAPQPSGARPSGKITSLMLRSSIIGQRTGTSCTNCTQPDPEYGPHKHFFDQDLPKHIQYHAIEQMVTSSMTSYRGLYIRFRKNPPKIDHFFSDIVPARIDSLFWDLQFSGNSYGFINFLHVSDASAFLSFFGLQKALHSWIHAEWSTRIIPIERSIAEASITNGATRILRVNEVPLDFTAARIWGINASPACGFRFVKLLRQDDKSLDYGLEFNSIANSINARRRLSAHPKLTRCGFIWMENNADRSIAAYTYKDIKLGIEKDGPPELISIDVGSAPVAG